MGLRLALETSAARALGGLSRAVGRGGGTTLPGKVLWKLDPGAVDALAARLPDGVVVISATNGKTTTTAMAAEILGEGRSLAWNRAGANLLSGIASALVAGRRAELGLFEVDEGALPEALERTKPRVVALGNLFRDQLDRYGELELVAERWRAAVANLPAQTTLVVNADDAVVADLADGRPGAVRFGLDDPRHARARLQHAADSKYCLRCGAPYEFAAAYVGHLGDYRCPSCGHARPPLDVVDPGDRAPRPPRVALSARDAGGRGGRRARPARPLQRLQRGRRSGSRARGGRVARGRTHRARAIRRRVRPVRADLAPAASPSSCS